LRCTQSYVQALAEVEAFGRQNIAGQKQHRICDKRTGIEYQQV
jgi:hypothetical protein